jgi:UDP-N-acetylmuramate--alanine ligase
MVGAGGVGMAGLAVQLRHGGLTVSGCDETPGAMLDWLAQRGVRVSVGHDSAHAREADWFIRTPAVDKDDAEMKAARARNLPVFDRGEVLPVLVRRRRSVAVSGTHGKTTTTAMITQALRGGGVDASFCIGADVPLLGGVAGVGKDDVLVVEADESDGTIALYEADYAVITNIEHDHVDFFPDLRAVQACFERFAARCRRRVIGCVDDPATAEVLRPLAGKAWTYGFTEGAALRGVDVREEAGRVSVGVLNDGREAGRLQLPVGGRHNALNALAACAAGLAWGLPFASIASSLARFGPARRRFEVMARAGGITVVSDYAHHPTEIEALMEQAAGFGADRILAVFQPHRYTRTAALGRAFPPAFRGCAEVFLAPVYAASEEPVPGGRSEDIFPYFQQESDYRSHLSQSLLDAWDGMSKIWRTGDLVLVVGAGDVEKIAGWAGAALDRGVT